MPSISLTLQGINYPCDGNDTILRAGLRAGVGMPYECNVGCCGTCKFELLEGEVDVIWPEAPGLSDRDRSKGRLLACQCRPVTSCQIKMRTDSNCVPDTPPQRQKVHLVEKRSITHDIVEFCFYGESPARFHPGQYAMLDLPGVSGARAYSMANLANDEGCWCFQIKHVPGGAGSDVLFSRLNVGDVVYIDAPYGLAYLRTDIQKDIVCIAGGSGIAPMLSIARGMNQATSMAARKLHFFYGGRSLRDLCGEEELRSLAGFGQRLFYHSAVSSLEDGQSLRSPTYLGYVHELVEAALGDAIASHEIYMAGPPPMVQAVEQLLQSKYGVSRQQIHFDRFF